MKMIKSHLPHFPFLIIHVVPIGCLCRQFASVSAFVFLLSPNLDMSTSTSHVTTNITTTTTRSKIATIGFDLVQKRDRHRVNRVPFGFVPHKIQKRERLFASWVWQKMILIGTNQFAKIYGFLEVLMLLLESVGRRSVWLSLATKWRARKAASANLQFGFADRKPPKQPLT